MADSIVARLKVLLGIDSAEFTSGAKEAESGWQSFQGRLVKGAKLVAGAIAAVGVGQLAGEIRRMADDSVRMAKDMTTAATSIGITTDELQQYRFVARQAGIEQGVMEDGLKELTMKLGEAAEGSKSTVALFERLGVGIRDANGQVHSGATALPLLADALARIESPAQRSTLLAQLFGEEAGPKLAGLAAVGSEGIAGMTREFDALGLKISGETLQTLGDLDKKLEEMNEKQAKMQADFIARNAEGIRSFDEAMMKIKSMLFDVVTFFDEQGRRIDANVAQQRAELAKFVDYWRAVPGRVIDAVQRLYEGVRTWLVDKLGPVMDWVRQKAHDVGQAFYELYDKVVGHSYVPDMVDEIGQHMRRLDQEMVAPAKSAAARTAAAFSALKDDISRIMADLFPEVREKLDLEQRVKVINDALKAGLISIDAHAKLLEAAQRKYLGLSRDFYARAEGQGPLDEITALNGGPSVEEQNKQVIARAGKALSKIPEQANEMRLRVVDSFAGMVDGAMRELDRFARGIKSGNWLDIIGGLLKAFDGIAGLFTGGKGFQIGGLTIGNGSFGSIPGFASGGSIALGGMSGIDRNLLSLNGEPLAKVSRGETMTITPANDRGFGGERGELVVRLEKDGSMSAYLAGIAGQVVDARGPAIARAGSDIAMAKMSRMRSKALG